MFPGNDPADNDPAVAVLLPTFSTPYVVPAVFPIDTVPLITVLLMTFRETLAACVISRSAFTVTPLSVPPEAVATNWKPASTLSVPPPRVPPASVKPRLACVVVATVIVPELMRSAASEVMLFTETFALETIVAPLNAAPICTSSFAPGSTFPDQLTASFQFSVPAPPSQETTDSATSVTVTAIS